MKALPVIFTLFAALLLRTSSAQTVLLHVDRTEDTVPQRHGPNRPLFTQIFLGGGFLLGPDRAGSRTTSFGSGEVMFGMRTKYKVGAVYSCGWDVRAATSFIKLKQEQGKRIPDTIVHRSGRIDISTLRLGFYNRFNLDPRRANTLGHYVDLGLCGDVIFSMTTLNKDKLPDGSLLKTERSRLPWSRVVTAGVYARIGLGRICFYGDWRLTPYFNHKNNFADLPVCMAGLEIGIY